MFEGLPQEYDVIIVGTGVTETIVAAACARIGKRVFQVDINDYYGSEWAAFSLESLLEWFTSEKVLSIGDSSHVFQKRKYEWYVDDEQRETIKKQSRKFNIDLTPKLVYATGGLVDLIVQSGVGKYSEYKLVSRILFEHQGKLQKVPSSRADVFNATDLSLIDKRLLMKVMMNCASMKIEELGEDRHIPFIEYLQKQSLNSTLCQLIFNSIAMLDMNGTTSEGFTKTKRYLQSIGRYGNSPFLHQQYGSGEISQCFSRLCAVFGGIQYLRFPLAGFIEDDVNQRCTGISSITGEQFRAADAVICNHIFVPTSVTYKTKVIERIILITNQSIKPSNDEEITFIRLNHDHQSNIHILEVGTGTGCSPPDLYLLYIFYERSTTSDHSNDQVIDRLIDLCEGRFGRTNILLKLSFEQHQIESISRSQSNMFITSGPDGTIDHDQAIDAARTIFQKIYSNGEAFLPVPPDPEDIVIDEEQPTI